VETAGVGQGATIGEMSARDASESAGDRC